MLMSFWDIEKRTDQLAIIDQRYGSFTYANLVERIQEVKQLLPYSGTKQLGLILCSNAVHPLIAYIASLQKRDAVMLLDEKLNQSLLLEILLTYKPHWIFASDKRLDFASEYICTEYHTFNIWLRKSEELVISIHPDLALLLSTSGTTGSMKFVRLSYQNIAANAKSIAAYLNITAEDRGLANLPLNYSYGLSTINSHLQAGATILLTTDSVVTNSFWEFMRKEKATSFAGVPYTYQILQRIGLHKMELPYLRYFTQAGGGLNEKLVRFFGEYAKEQNKKFYVMYGQTEATARISYMPPEKVLEKPTSIGIAIPDGRLELDPDTGELIYEGLNVMFGYATCMNDLAKGDELQGRLHTGDIATVDRDGFYFIKGRMKRFIKLFGLRLNLDEIGKQIEASLHTENVCVGNDDRMVIAILKEEQKEKIEALIEELYKLHRSAFRVKVIDEFPRLANGKINYEALKELVL